MECTYVHALCINFMPVTLCVKEDREIPSIWPALQLVVPMSVQKTVPVSTSKGEEDEEEDVFIRESREVGAEFVKLFLGEEGDVVSRGPDDARVRGEAAAPLSPLSGLRTSAKLSLLGHR